LTQIDSLFQNFVVKISKGYLIEIGDLNGAVEKRENYLLCYIWFKSKRKNRVNTL